MSFMDRLKKKVGKRGDEPKPAVFDPPKDTVPEPSRKRRATAIVCSRGSGGGCQTVVLEADVVELAGDELAAPWPDRLAHGSRPRPLAEWPPEGLSEVVERVPTLTDAELPAFPFALTEFMRVTGPAWLAGLKSEVDRGAQGARARLGTLQDELRSLARILAGGGPCLAKSGSRACRKDSGHLPPH